jgi:hypothetical protein
MRGQTRGSPRRVSLHLGNGLGELRPDVVAETPVTLPWAFTIAVPSEMV